MEWVFQESDGWYSLYHICSHYKHKKVHFKEYPKHLVFASGNEFQWKCSECWKLAPDEIRVQLKLLRS